LVCGQEITFHVSHRSIHCYTKEYGVKHRSTKDIFEKWISAFQSRDVETIVSLYHDDAVNWQIADRPAEGKEEIRKMMESFFTSFPDAYTKIENILYDGDWAAWEWTGGGTFLKDMGDIKATGKQFEIRGCGFFLIQDEKVKLQRGYWDKANWCKQIGIDADSTIK
jgi:steroid delta-isomerase-like uncharacterized protein